jgi:hypothetical protein
MGEVKVSKEEQFWQQVGFEKGVFAERTRLIAYLVENGIVRLDALGFWVRNTMGDGVTDLPELEPDFVPEPVGDGVRLHPKVVGAMLVAANRSGDERLRDRLIALRALSDAGSPVSIRISEWVKEIG